MAHYYWINRNLPGLLML